MNNNGKQNNLLIIAAVLLLIVGIANYKNYYAPPKSVAEVFSFSSMSDKEQKSLLDEAKKQGSIDKNAKKNTKNKKEDKNENDDNLNVVDVSNDNLDDNYMNYVVDSKGKMGRWKNTKISVYVSESEYQNNIYKALIRYNDLFEGYFKFYLTSNRDKANIKIEVVDKISSNSKNNDIGYISGLTDYSYDSNDYLRYAYIQLLSRKPNSNKKFTQSEIYVTTLHELGHALGIKGHSPNEHDIMYASSSKSKEKNLSKRDINTLKIMYSGNQELIKKYTKDYASTKLNEDEEYAKNLPNKAVSWIALGQTYYDQGKKEEALEAYKKALALEPNNASIYSTMSSCYYESQKYETAIKYCKIAIERISEEPQKVGCYTRIGSSYDKLKDYENAYIYLKKAYSADKSADIFKNYLISCAQLDKKQEVLSAIQSYKSKNPDIMNEETVKQIYKWASQKNGKIVLE